MTQREIGLKADGYHYYNGYDTNAEAKEKALSLRSRGWRATVITESRSGIGYYSVWTKREEGR